MGLFVLFGVVLLVYVMMMVMMVTHRYVFLHSDYERRNEFLSRRSMNERNTTLEKQVGQLNKKLGIMELLAQDKLVCE